MGRLTFRCVVAGLLVAAASTSPAAVIGEEPGSTGQLFGQCKEMEASMEGQSVSKDPQTMIGVGVCAGYLAAFKDAQIFMPHGSQMHACIPTDVSVMQLGRVFVKWADSHPEVHHQSRVLGVFSAVRGAFPCD